MPDVRVTCKMPGRFSQGQLLGRIQATCYNHGLSRCAICEAWATHNMHCKCWRFSQQLEASNSVQLFWGNKTWLQLPHWNGGERGSSPTMDSIDGGGPGVGHTQVRPWWSVHGRAVAHARPTDAAPCPTCTIAIPTQVSAASCKDTAWCSYHVELDHPSTISSFSSC